MVIASASTMAYSGMFVGFAFLMYTTMASLNKGTAVFKVDKSRLKDPDYDPNVYHSNIEYPPIETLKHRNWCDDPNCGK